MESSGRTVAVSGASGLIGSALADELRRRGDVVKPLVRRRAEPGEIAWDPVAGTIDEAGFEGVDAVVHLAGEGIARRRWSDAQRSRIRDSRVEGTKLVAGALARCTTRPAVLLSGSAIGIYGDQGDRLLTESSAPAATFLADLCRDWEAATAEAEQAGVRVAHLRTGVVLARDGGALAKMLPLFRLGLGGRMGSGRQYWSWISLTDVVGAITFLLDAQLAGPVNLTAPEPVTNRAFTAALGRVLSRPTLLSVPSFGPKLLLGAELAHELLFSSARVFPAALGEAGFRFVHDEVESGLRAELDR
ncbi:MAG: TIGR01777 family oxidoreductase [Acidimicrobiia bacterium]|nr:TIGR01777 family oxidoreductase [Acidimicrobiia bacterium]